MFKQLSTSLLIASACILSSCTPTVKQEIAILPTPVSLTEQSGAFVLKDGMKIGVSDQSLYNRQIKKFPTEKQNVSLKHILT